MNKCACIAKKEVLYVFPFGLFAWLCGTIFINRRDSRQSQMTISTSAEKIREEKVPTINQTKLIDSPQEVESNKLYPYHVVNFSRQRCGFSLKAPEAEEKSFCLSRKEPFTLP